MNHTFTGKIIKANTNLINLDFSGKENYILCKKS
jgi:hypothetical protein